MTLKTSQTLDPKDQKIKARHRVVVTVDGPASMTVSPRHDILPPKPEFTEAFQAHKAGRRDEAIRLYDAFLLHQPGRALAWMNLGAALANEGQNTAALVCYKKALLLNDQDVVWWTNYAKALNASGQYQSAVDAYQKALDIEPDHANHLRQKGAILTVLGRYEQAMACFEQALRVEPDFVLAQWALCLTYLAMGDYVRGWGFYESRLRLEQVKLKPNFAGQPWHGEDLTGKTILLFAEQGMGDAMMALRFAPWVKAQGAAHVYFECQKPLQRLCAEVEGIDYVTVRGSSVPRHDYYCSLLSLPDVFDVRLEALPPPPRLAWSEQDRQRFQGLVDRYAKPTDLKVGIVWAGSAHFKDNHLRSATLEHFLRFASIPHVRLFSLQKEPGHQALAELDCPALVVDLAAHIDDFADTAAALQALDLVVMTDSSVAHLAGSLDIPIWNLLNTSAYWPYQLYHDHTPWYASMRLFRQTEPGAWDALFDRVAWALRSAADRKATGEMNTLRPALLPSTCLTPL